MMDIFDTKGLKPMLIAEQVEPFDNPNYIYELKLDGIRCIAYCDKGTVDLRNKRDMKLLPRFPELKDLYKGCRCKCILDGELNILINGKPNFYEVQKRTLLTDPFKIQLSYTRYPANFVAYDVVYYENHTVNELPLMERKQILSGIILESNILSVSRFIENDGKVLFELAKQENLEGVVAKEKNSLYWFGKRTHDWKKIKVMSDRDYIIIGYIPKANHMTTLVLALYDENNKLRITNHVTLGVSVTKLKEQGMQLGNCPFDKLPNGYENTIWIQPIVGIVEFMPSEKEGLRQPVFKGVRDDKCPEECRIESL